MQFRAKDWVNHPHFGLGQIIEDNDSHFVIQFVNSGEKKKIATGFELAPGNPPHPGFTFPKPPSIKEASSKAKESCFACKDVFPFIQEVIERLCQQFGKAEHDAIVDKLGKHPEGASVIELAVVRCPHFSKQRIASNMVQWMSQHYTEGDTDADVFVERFQRHKDGKGNWVYSLR